MDLWVVQGLNNDFRPDTGGITHGNTDNRAVQDWFHSFITNLKRGYCQKNLNIPFERESVNKIECKNCETIVKFRFEKLV